MLVLIMALGTAAQASEEEFLGWSEVHIVSAGHPETGRVVFAAEVRDNVWRKVDAEAFGKKFSLDEKQCEQLKGFPLSSITTSHGAGYEEMGGHTVDFKFKKTFHRDGALVQAIALISISRGKGLKVWELPERVLAEKKE